MSGSMSKDDKNVHSELQLYLQNYIQEESAIDSDNDQLSINSLNKTELNSLSKDLKDNWDAISVLKHPEESDRKNQLLGFKLNTIFEENNKPKLTTQPKTKR